ncbi:MAG: Chromosome (Plasmid) partitioning protein ParB / Stage 0 sporulation protein J [Clostridiales bacterium 38_11]|nr:MAG: Chromosome (Plasmid) partitioning protein ParB / Stage 0 sporulation protein J [Clostridiales bacterium 38_11]HBH12807.1 nucleoid occlusion protein [Clostridiales bacterium]
MEPLQKVELINMDQISPNRHQPRRAFDQKSLIELSSSIKSYGLIQPITLREKDIGYYEIIAGERRFRAAQLAGMKEIPSIVMVMADKDSSAMALIENLQREDLNALEEAEAYLNLMIVYGINQSELGERIGKTQSTIANKLRLLKLQDGIKDMIINGELTERHCRCLLKLKEEPLQLRIARKILKKNMTVAETEELIDGIIKKRNGKKANESKRSIKNHINYKIYVNTIKHAYNEILKTGVKAGYEEDENEEQIEVKIRIPKNRT